MLKLSYALESSGEAFKNPNIQAALQTNYVRIPGSSPQVSVLFDSSLGHSNAECFLVKKQENASVFSNLLWKCFNLGKIFPGSGPICE